MKDPAFLMYSKDWLTGTAEMSHTEKGVYIDLLCYQHQNNGLPSQIEKIARIAGMSLNEFKPIWDELKCKFAPGENDRLFNGKLTNEIKRRGDFSRTKTIFGIFGAFVKKLDVKKAVVEKIKEAFDYQEFKEIEQANLKAEVEAKLKLLLKQYGTVTATEAGTATSTLEKGGVGEKTFPAPGTEHHFRDSEYFFNKSKWYDALPVDWPQAKSDYWWEKVDYWSRQKKKNKKIDWPDTARHWEKDNPWKGEARPHVNGNSVPNFEQPQHIEPITKLISAFNEFAETRHDPKDPTIRKPVNLRLMAGANPEDMHEIIQLKCREWGTDKRHFLTLNALFGDKNYANFLQEVQDIKDKKRSPNISFQQKAKMQNEAIAKAIGQDVSTF